MRKLREQKGITLVALIITMIIMLLLVGATITISLNGGLFKTAKKAEENTQLAKEEELIVSNGTVNIGGEETEIDQYGNSSVETTLIPEELEEGDIIEYIPVSNYKESSPYTVDLAGCTGSFYTDMGETVQWKVLSVLEDKIEIIPNAMSLEKITLEGANGWNNSINALNSVCGAIYGNTTSDKYIATAESITVEDINKIVGYTPAVPKSYSASNYGTNNKFPIEYLKERGEENPIETTEGCGYAENLSITVEDTNYYYSTAESMSGFNPKFENWVKLDDVYWLASRSANASRTSAAFRVRYINAPGGLNSDSLFSSGNFSYPKTFKVRPVVTLTPLVEMTLEKTEVDGENTINYWKF